MWTPKVLAGIPAAISGTPAAISVFANAARGWLDYNSKDKSASEMEVGSTDNPTATVPTSLQVPLIAIRPSYTQPPVTEQRPDDVMPDDDDASLDEVDKDIADANAASKKDNEAAAKSRATRATRATRAINAKEQAACPVNPVEDIEKGTEEVQKLLTSNGKKKGIVKKKIIYSNDPSGKEEEGEIQFTETDSQIQQHLNKLKQISACVSAQEAVRFDENIQKVTDLLAVTRDKLGPDSSRLVFEGTAMEGTNMDQIRRLVHEVLHKKEFRTSLQTLSPQQLKELASYIVLKHKAMEVNESTVNPFDLPTPYNGIPFYTEPSQKSPLQICFLSGETLESRGLRREPDPAELQAVSCVLADDCAIRLLVMKQRAFVSANPDIASMQGQCLVNFLDPSPYHRRLTAEELGTRTGLNLGLTDREVAVFTNAGVNGLAGMWASAFGSPTPPDYFNKSKFIVPSAPFDSPTAPPPPPPPGVPPPPGGDPYTVLYDFTNKVGPRVSIPYIPANYPPPTFPDPDWSAPFPSVMIGGKRLLYSIGPILFDDHLFGRPLIMIRLHNYKTAQHPDGIYFWVYPSFSESGLGRVYFTIDGGMILKGIDYTITTFVLEFLQVEINRYYVRHYVNKLPNGFFPTKLTTPLQILNFFGEMIHLQHQWVYDFLCGLGIIPSPYVRDHAPIPPDFNRHCYVFYSNPCRALAAPPAPPAPPPSFPPFYPDDPSSLQLAPLVGQNYSPTRINTLRQCVSHGIDLALIKQERWRTQREDEIFASFMTMNATYRGDNAQCTFPLRLCISTVMDKILVPVAGGGVQQQRLFSQNVVSDWPFTQWVQGCRDLGRCSISPVIVTIAGVTPDLKDLAYNSELAVDGFAPKILAKQYLDGRLVTTTVTQNEEEEYQLSMRQLRSGTVFNRDVHFITFDPEIGTLPPLSRFATPDGNFSAEGRRQYMIGRFALLPRAIKMSVERMADLFCDSNPVYNNVKVSFERLLRIPSRGERSSSLLMPDGNAWGVLFDNARTAAAAAAAANRANVQASIDARARLLEELQIHILIKSSPVLTPNQFGVNVLEVLNNSPLDVIKKTMEVTGVYRDSIASSIFQSFLGIPGFKLTLTQDGFPPGEEVKLYYLDKLGQYRSIEPEGNNPRNFLSCFTNPNFDPYIIDSVRMSESITPGHLKEFLLGQNVTREELPSILERIRQGGQIKSAKVFSKMFLLRLLFQNGNNKIQLVVSVSSTITIAGNSLKYVPFATDLQFTPTFIGPVDGDGTGQTFETVIATAVRYISAGCSVATKPADYSQLSGSAQYLKFLEVFFRQFCSVCFTYNSTQIGSFNCQHDPMLKFLTCVFSDPDAIQAITNKWDWSNYLSRKHGYNLADESALRGQILGQNIQSMLVDNRLRVLEVCRILIDPMLKRLGRTAADPQAPPPGPRPGGPRGPDDDDDDGDGDESSLSSPSRSTSVDSTYWQKILDDHSMSTSIGSDKTFNPSPPPPPSSSASPKTPGELYMNVVRGVAFGNNPSTSVDPMEPGGGSLINKKYMKKNNHKSQNKNKNKSKNRKTTRKNLKFKRMIKKHTTKYKTYKRKANGRKLRGNKHKNNKTMRRYRCVRK